MTSMGAVQKKVQHPYITQKEGTCGGKPIITGTRIKVSHIVLYHNDMGYTPERIQAMFPHLTLAQVYDALSYYYDHQEEMDEQMAEENRMAENMEREHASILERKRGNDSDLHR